MKKLLKALYNYVPFKQTLFSLLKLCWKPSEAIYKHLHFRGIIKVVVENSRTFKIRHYGFQIENEIFWEGLTGGWEKVSIGIWIKLCKRSEVIFDIGANTGVYALIAKTINPNARVYAFEPVKRVFEKLQENILLNKFDITAIDKAVSNNDGVASIFDSNAEHVYSVTVNKNMTTDVNAKETKIETITLNSLIKNQELKKVDLIKIDVETHEPEVLEGFSDYLATFKPVLLIEILTDEIGEQVSKIVAGLDYLYFNINEKGDVRQTSKISQSDYFNYLLCDKKTAQELQLKME